MLQETLLVWIFKYLSLPSNHRGEEFSQHQAQVLTLGTAQK